MNALPAYPLPKPEFQIRPIDSVEECFRHSGWQEDRRRTFEALLATHARPSRLDAFANCGSSCCVQYSASRQQYRLSGFYCHDRFCGPCATAKAATMARRFVKAASGKTIRFITLTLKHNKNPLSDQLSRLVNCFNLLRRRGVWKCGVTGGASFIEMKLSKYDGCWHPHLHCLVEGSYIAQKDLALAWYACTGDSFIVDIRPVKGIDEAIGYVTKYAGKPVGGLVLRTPEKLQEAVICMHGRRFCTTFGNWHGVTQDDEDPGLNDWGTVSSLAGLLEAADAGVGLAVRMYHSLFHHAPPEHHDKDSPLFTEHDEAAKVAAEDQLRLDEIEAGMALAVLHREQLARNTAVTAGQARE